MRPGFRSRAFTLPEAVVTMTLIVIFVVVAGGLLYQGNASSRRHDQAEGQAGEKAALVWVFSQVCQRVSPPEWASPKNTFHEEADGLTAAYWDGDEKLSVRLTTRPDGLTLTTPDGHWSWKQVVPKAAFWKVEGRVVGLELTWTENGTARVLRYPWAGRPL